MRIAVLIFFNPESAIFFLKFHTDIDIHIFVIRIILVILYVAIAEFSQAGNKLPLPVNHSQDANIISLPDPEVVGPKGWSSMHDAGTIFGGHKITQSDLKSVRIICLIGFERKELLI